MGAALLLFMHLAGPQPSPPLLLPLSLDEAKLETCAPTSVDAAVSCLREALSAEDLAVVQDRIPARVFRPGLDRAIEGAFHLRDRTSPMAKVMRALIGIDRPDIAAGMIISDLQVRATSGDGHGLDFDAMARAFRENPPPPENPLPTNVNSPQGTPHAD